MDVFKTLLIDSPTVLASDGTGLLQATNNLSDIDDVPAARDTLDVYSKEEVDSQTITRATAPAIIHDGKTSGSRQYWPLGAAGAIGTGDFTVVLDQVYFPSVVPGVGAGILTFSGVNTDIGSTAGLGLYYVPPGGALRVNIGDVVGGGRRYKDTTISASSVYGGTRQPVALRRTGALVDVFVGGQKLSFGADTTSGTTPPAWGAAFACDYFLTGVFAATNLWPGAIGRSHLVNSALSDAEVLVHAQTGLLPDWAATGVGSMVAKTSGTLTIGCKYRITSAGGTFTGVGSPDNNVGTEFVANNLSPTWGTGAVVQLGPVFRPRFGPNYSIRDAGANGINGVRMSGTSYSGPETDDVLVGTLAHSGAGNLQLLGNIALDTRFGWAIDRVIVNSTAAVTWSLGNASGGAQYVSAKSLSVGKNILKDSDLVSALTSGANLWSAVSAAATLTITVQLIRC